MTTTAKLFGKSKTNKYSIPKGERLLLWNPWPKQGAIDIVRNIVNSLFSLLELEHARKMTKTIYLTKQEEVHDCFESKHQIGFPINIFKNIKTVIA